MTAEIAILNRSAVALAADSAVTLGIRGQQKIYNSVDKLFQLSLSEPVGIMIFGGAEYMGVPIETVIKKFRNSELCCTKKNLKDYSEAFFSYLENEIPVPEELSASNAERIIAERLAAIREKMVQRYMQAVRSASDQADKMVVQDFFQNQLSLLVRAQIESLKKQPDNACVRAEKEDGWIKKRVENAAEGALEFPLTGEINESIILNEN